MTAKQYPETAALIAELAGSKFEGATLKDREIVEKINEWAELKLSRERYNPDCFTISEPAYRNYRQGLRLPKDTPSKKTATLLAEFFASGEDGERRPEGAKSVLKRLEASATSEPRSFLEQLGGGSRKLKIQMFDYGVFCSAQQTGDGFFNKVFNRFFALSGVRVDPVGLENNLDYVSSLATGAIDVVYAYFSSPDRALHVKFWETPLRLSLSACGLRANLKDDRKREAAEILTGQKPARPDDYEIRPVVLRNEVGHRYCAKVLGLSDNKMVFVDSLNPKTYADRLRRLSLDLPSEIIAIAVADEYTILGVVNELKREAACVFPVSSRTSVTSDPLRRVLPQYRVSIGTSRRNKDFTEYLADCLPDFTLTEPEMLSQEFKKLFAGITRFLYETAPYLEPQYDYLSAGSDDEERERREIRARTLAWGFARHCMQIDQESIDLFVDRTIPWKHILTRTRELVLGDIYNKPKTALKSEPGKERSLIERVIRYHLDGLPTLTKQSDLSHLFRDLDYRPSDSRVGDHGRHENTESLMTAILKGVGQESSPKLHVLEKEIAETDQIWSKVRTLMRRLQSMYDGQSSIDQTIHENIHKVPMIDGGRAEFVVAKYQEEELAGQVCIQYRDENTCQLRYLWVETVARGSRLGKKLIEAALEHVAKTKTTVHVDIRRSQADVAKIVRDCGFEEKYPVPFPGEAEGRIRFSKNLKKATPMTEVQ